MSEAVSNDGRANVRADRWALAGMLLLIGVLYGPTLGYGLLSYDDPGYITENPLLPLDSWGKLHTIFFEYYYAQYSPFQILSYAIDYAIAGEAPWIYHLHNLLYFAGTAVLIYCALRKRLPVSAAWAATLLWTVHPLHVEAVSWASERKGAMSLFYVWAAFLALRAGLEASGGSKRIGWGVAGFLLWWIGVFTKATVVPTGFLMFAYFRLIEKRSLKSLLPTGSAIAALTLLTIAITLQSDPNARETTLKTEMYGGGLWATLRIMIPIWLDYWRQILWPTNLQLRYLVADMGSYLHPRVLIPLLGLTAMTAAAIIGWMRGRRGWALAFAGFYVSLSPVLGLFPINFFQADRYLHGPMIFPFILVGVAYAGTSGTRRRIATAILLGTAVAWSALTIEYRTAWRSDESLWRDQLSKNRHEISYYVNYISTLWKQERFEEAQPILQAGLEAFPENGWLLHYEAMGADRLGDFERAARAYGKALEQRPELAEAAKRLGEIRFHQGRPLQALEAFRGAIEALELRPTVRQPAHYGRPDPDMIWAYRNLGSALEALGRSSEAEEAWKAGLAYGPNAWELLNPLSLAAYRRGQLERWAQLMERSLNANPQQPNAEILREVVETYRKSGEMPLGR